MSRVFFRGGKITRKHTRGEPLGSIDRPGDLRGVSSGLVSSPPGPKKGSRGKYESPDGPQYLPQTVEGGHKTPNLGVFTHKLTLYNTPGGMIYPLPGHPLNPEGAFSPGSLKRWRSLLPRYRKMTDREYKPREQRLVNDFIRKYFPDYPHQTRVRIGPYKRRWEKLGYSPEEMRLLGVNRRMVDALVLLPDRVLLIEGTITPELGTTGYLLHYKDLFPKTPEFSEHSQKPIGLIWVCVLEDPMASVFAREQGVRVVCFRPYWTRRYLANRYP